MDKSQKTRLGTSRVKRVWPHKLWWRLFVARRMYRRLKAQVRRLQRSHAEQLKAVTERYEEHLALERARYTEMQTEWSSRLVQAFGQQPILATDLAAGVTDPKYRRRESEGRLTDLLSAEAQERYEDEKDRFFREGLENGMSPAAIQERWAAVEENVIEDLL